MKTCPHCLKTLEVVAEKPQSEKDFYLEWWTPTLGAEAALASWEEKQLNRRIAAPAVMSDIEGYISQVDGSYIDSRSKHRSHLKQHNMIEMGNDVPMEQKKLDTRHDRERRDFIGRQVYEKFR